MPLSASVAFHFVPRRSRLHGKSSAEKAAAYEAVCRGYRRAGLRAGANVCANGEIFDEAAFLRLMDIPEIKE